MPQRFLDLTTKSSPASEDPSKVELLDGSAQRQKKKLTSLEVSRGDTARGNPSQTPSKALRGSMLDDSARGNPARGFFYKMKGHVEQCVERYLELAQKPASCLRKVATPCIDDHQLAPEDFTTKGELSHVCARIVLKALYAARTGRPDCLWAVKLTGKRSH